MSRFWKQTLAISVAFLAAYAVMRSLPVEPCEVLHNKKQLVDGVEQFCGSDDADYLAATQLRFPVSVQLVAAEALVPGKATQLAMTFLDIAGQPLAADAIAVSHGEQVHVMVVSEDLEDYHHLHPEPDDAGTFITAFTPAKAGNYRCFIEFVSLASGRSVVLVDDMMVTPSGSQLPVNPNPSSLQVAIDQREFAADSRFEFELEVSAAGHDSLRFDPVMNTYAHVVIFDAERAGLAHAHPVNYALVTEPMADPELRFSVRLPEPGKYRLWAQVQVEGQLEQFPFDLVVTN